MIRVLIGDDHRIVREGLKQVLADAPEVRVVAEAATGPEVIDQVRRAPDALDLVLLDIALPERDGLDVLQVLKRDHAPLPVLMLSTYPERQFAARCLKLGAAGYLHKSADPDEMLRAVRKAAAGGVHLSAAAAEALVVSLGAAQRAGTTSAGIDALSHREHQVFRLLVTGLSVSEIGARLGLASNTVSTYRARILDKTGARNDVELAVFAERLARTG